MKKGKTIKLKATLNKAEGIYSGAKKQAVIWKSSNPKVATVSQKGVIRAVSAGTAKIWVTAADGSGKKDSCTVTVTENTVPVFGQPEEPENPEQPEQPEEPDDSEKTLVVYFGTPVRDLAQQEQQQNARPAIKNEI